MNKLKLNKMENAEIQALKLRTQWLLWSITILSILSFLAFFLGFYSGSRDRALIKEAKVYADIITENTIKWEETKANYLIELELAKIRADIYKNQINNLLAVNNGLKTIINKDPETKEILK